MIERLSRRDVLFFLVMAVGVVAAIFHVVDGRIMNGILVGLVMAVGIGVRITMILNPEEASSSSVRSREGGQERRGDRGDNGDYLIDRESWLRNGIIAGFLATVLMSLVMMIGYFSSGIFADQNGSRVEQWFYGLTHNTLTDSAFDIPIGAYSLNLLAGAVWALLYAWFFEPRLGGPGWRRGVIFSIIPWVVSVAVFFPAVGAGLLGTDLDAGPLPALGNLILHLVYGAALGSVYAIPETAGLSTAPEDARAARWENRGLAFGLAFGCAAGVVIGGVLALIFNGGLVDSSEFILAGAAAGIMAGAVLGPFIGLEYGNNHSAREA